ncbi:hypothetical protein [Actinomadura sp. 6N118]|uniref:hypothetical protein n=1 Tax=Actinomadura sp. 6N118 TaxID=3375151 RepID=UPI0037AB6621
MKLRTKRTATVLFAAGAAAALTAGLAPAASAAPTAPVRAADDPIPTFDFSDCPKLPDGAKKEASYCINVVVTSGKLVTGNIANDVTEPIKLTYSSVVMADNTYKTVFGAMRTKESKMKDGIFKDPFTEVWGKPEYVGGFTVQRFNITMDIKMNLTRPFLLVGGCSIGNNTVPIKLKLITGTTNPPAPNTPITGKKYTVLSTNPHVASLTHVDNSFDVPGAGGCWLDTPLRLVSGLVNSQGGLPSVAGKNTVIFNEYLSQRSYSELS